MCTIGVSRPGFDVSDNKRQLCTMVTLGKWQGDCYIQSDRYMQVNFAQKLRQLKIFGINYPVTVIYRVTTIYRGVIQI